MPQAPEGIDIIQYLEQKNRRDTEEGLSTLTDESRLRQQICFNQTEQHCCDLLTKLKLWIYISFTVRIEQGETY